MSKLCFGVGVDVRGKRTVPWLLLVTSTNSVDAGAGDCAEAGGGVAAGCLSLAGGVAEAVAVAEGGLLQRQRLLPEPEFPLFLLEQLLLLLRV